MRWVREGVKLLRLLSKTYARNLKFDTEVHTCMEFSKTYLPFSIKALLILLMPAIFAKKSAFFGKNSAFTQSNSVRAVFEIFQLCLQLL